MPNFYLPPMCLRVIIKAVASALKNILAVFLVAPLAVAAAPLCSACPAQSDASIKSLNSAQSEAHACCNQKARVTAAVAHEPCKNCLVASAASASATKEKKGHLAELALAAIRQSASEVIIPDLRRQRSFRPGHVAAASPPAIYLLQQKILI